MLIHRNLIINGNTSHFLLNATGKVYQVNNLITFSRKPIGPEEFLNQMIEALGILINRCFKESPRKMEAKP